MSGTGAPRVLGLHHWAWRCRDAEETRHFYEDILGLRLVHFIRADTVPSTGEHCPYTHLFFELGDGSSVAFFDLGDDTAAEPSPNTPAWVNHLALKLESIECLEQMKLHLETHGINVLGVTDHGFVKSIYFFDPNGVRIEFTADSASAGELMSYRKGAHAQLDDWSLEKAIRRGERRQQ